MAERVTVSTQTRVSHDSRLDFFDETPATLVAPLPLSEDVYRTLDRIDRVLRAERDTLPAARTTLSDVPQPIPTGSTANLALVAALVPAISAAQLSFAAALAPAISAAQLSFAAALAPAISAAQLSFAAALAPATSAAELAQRPGIHGLELPWRTQRMDAGQPAVAQHGPTTAHLELCLLEVREWLGVGLNEASRASGIDRGTVYAWRRRGSQPRPGTVGAVLRLHSVVAWVVAVAGAEAAREWFRAGTPSPLDQLIATAGNPNGLSAVGRQARRAFTDLPPPNLLLGSTVDDLPAESLA